MNLKVDSDALQELLDTHNQELTIVELIDMQDIEELDCLDHVRTSNERLQT